jgi:predicted type IV restriction endonuclease
MQKDEKIAGRWNRQIKTEEAAQTNLQAVKDKRAAHKCQACGTDYKQESNLADIVCIPIADASKNNTLASSRRFLLENRCCGTL